MEPDQLPHGPELSAPRPALLPLAADRSLLVRPVAGLDPATYAFSRTMAVSVVVAEMILRQDYEDERRLGLHHDQSAEWNPLRRHHDQSCSSRLGAPIRPRHSFTKQYGLRRLVYAEGHDDILAAKQRERNIKHWKRAWKVQLILRDNPNWEDLYDRLA